MSSSFEDKVESGQFAKILHGCRIINESCIHEHMSRVYMSEPSLWADMKW